MSSRILPIDFDRDTGFFFQAARERRLVYRVCNACGRGIHVPTQFCGTCGSDDTDWREACGRGQLFSWTTVTHQVHPAYPVPYTIVLVALEEAPEVRLIGTVQGVPELSPDQAMEVYFETVEDDIVLPQWRAAQKDDGQ